MPDTRSADPGTYVQVKGECVQIAVVDAEFGEDQAYRLMSEIRRRINKLTGVKRTNVSLFEGTMSIVPEFGHAPRNQKRDIMQALIKEIIKIFKRHYARAARSKQVQSAISA